jgi:hypothetical protein
MDAGGRATQEQLPIQCHGWQAQTHLWSLDSGNPGMTISENIDHVM